MKSLKMNEKIKDFYKTDGVDYKYRRWEENRVAKFDYKHTEIAIKKFLRKSHFIDSLEIGCGPGTWTEILKKHTDNLIAVDISETMLNEAKKNINDPNIKFISSDIMDVYIDKKFDLIFSIRAFEYFPQKEEFIKKCFNLLNKDGEIFIITKTKGSYWYGRTKIRKLFKFVLPFLFYYENKGLTKNNLENLSNFQQERLFTREFESLLKNNGFTSIVIKPVIIRPPIFMCGKSEIPIVPPLLEKPILFVLNLINKTLSNYSPFTIFAESYSITGKKK